MASLDARPANCLVALAPLSRLNQLDAIMGQAAELATGSHTHRYRPPTPLADYQHHSTPHSGTIGIRHNHLRRHVLVHPHRQRSQFGPAICPQVVRYQARWPTVGHHD